MKNTSVIVIPLCRYEELLDLETRVNVIVERIDHNKTIDIESLLWMLGTELSVSIANEIREGERKVCIDFTNLQLMLKEN